MNMMQLVALGGSLSKLKMGADAAEFSPLLKMLGVSEELGGKFVTAMKASSSDNSQNLSDFIESGGIMHALGAFMGSETGEVVNSLEACPHCGEYIVR
jgi:hypothetical protein